MSDKNEINDELKKFNKQKLKKTVTEEKNTMPSQQEIDDEKAAMKQEK